MNHLWFLGTAVGLLCLPAKAAAERGGGVVTRQETHKFGWRWVALAPDQPRAFLLELRVMATRATFILCPGPLIGSATVCPPAAAQKWVVRAFIPARPGSAAPLARSVLLLQLVMTRSVRNV